MIKLFIRFNLIYASNSCVEIASFWWAYALCTYGMGTREYLRRLSIGAITLIQNQAHDFLRRIELERVMGLTCMLSSSQLFPLLCNFDPHIYILLFFYGVEPN